MILVAASTSAPALACAVCGAPATHSCDGCRPQGRAQHGYCTAHIIVVPLPWAGEGVALHACTRHERARQVRRAGGGGP